MPVSPAMAEDLARAVTMLYEDAELALIEILRDALAQGIDSPRWAELKLRALGDLREAVETVAVALQTDANGAVAEALITAYGRGRQAAVAELGALDIGRELHARRILPGAPAVDRLAASYAADTRPLYQRITRSVLDVFRNVTSRAAGTQLLTGMARRDASQRALNDFARRGVTGFRDSRGHAWELAAYAEMAVRSVTSHAAIDGHIDALAEVGQGLVIVSDAPMECELCAPWEGEVLALAGGPGPRTVRLEHAVQPTGLRSAFRAPTTVAVHIAGSLLEARTKGLYHPNCRHSLALYLPGVTTRPPHPATPGTTYADTQRQRAIERHIREWKRREVAALDDAARAKARTKVREWQAAARAHVAAHEHIVRKPAREQIGRAH